MHRLLKYVDDKHDMKTEQQDAGHEEGNDDLEATETAQEARTDTVGDATVKDQVDEKEQAQDTPDEDEAMNAAANGTNESKQDVQAGAIAETAKVQQNVGKNGN